MRPMSKSRKTFNLDDTDNVQSGTKKADTIVGNGGNDNLSGLGGKDKINGGAGRDGLVGGTGADTFIYAAASDSAASAAGKWSKKTGDTISDFVAGSDTIDLAALAAASTNRSLVWSGSKASAGGVWFTAGKTATTLFADTNGDGKADFAIKLTGKIALTAADIIGLGKTPSNNSPVVPATLSVTASEDADTPVQQIGATDPDTGDTLSYAIAADANAPQHGAVTFDGKGGFIYRGAKDFSGNDTFQIIVSDGKGGTATQTVTITVNPVNDAPVLANATASFSVNEDTDSAQQSVAATDVDDAALTHTLGTGTNAPQHGVVTLNATTRQYTYKGNQNYSGPDSFQIIVSDGKGGTATQTVNVTVNPVNDAPVANATVSVSVNEDTGSAQQSVGATDVDDTALTHTLGTGTNGPQHGIVTLDAATGQYTYKGNQNYSGPDSFQIVVSDGKGGTVTQTVTVTVDPVNDAPVLANPTISVVVNEDTVSAQHFVVATDVEDTAFTYTLDTVSNALLHGVVTLNSNGAFTYKGDQNFNGTDAFTITVSDGKGGVTTQTVNVTVNPVNDILSDTGTGLLAPGLEDEVGRVILDSELLAGLSDPDGALSVTALAVDHGNVNRNAAGDGWDYTPELNYNGPVQLTVTVRDAVGGTTPGVPRIFFLASVNDPVSAVTDADGTPNQVAETVAIGTNVGITALATDPDADSTVLYSLDDDAGGLFTINATTGVVSVAKAIDFETTGATKTIIVRATSDVSATTQAFAIAIGNVNEAPVAAATATLNVDEDTISAQQTVGATDVDGDTPTYALGTGADAPQHGTVDLDTATGQYTYRGAPDYAGTDSFTITVSDGNSGTVTQTVNVTVNPVDDGLATIGAQAPGLVDGTEDQTGYSLTDQDLLAGVSDPDGSLTVTAVTANQGSFSRNATTGAWDYTASADVNGAVTITFTVRDAQGFDTTGLQKTFNLTAEDDAPRISSATTAAWDENIAANSIVYTATGSDPEGTAIVWSLTGTDANAFAIDADTGVVTINQSPDYETKTSYAITVNATSNGLTTSQDVTIGINNLNDNAPTGNPTAVLPDAFLSMVITSQTLVDGLTDADGNDVRVSFISADKGSFTPFEGLDSWIYKPDASGHVGPVTITYIASDGEHDITRTLSFNLTNRIDLTSLAGDQGFIIQGDPYDLGRTGWSVASAGDINGDGFDDMVVGAIQAINSDRMKSKAGAAYVIFGHQGGFGTPDAINTNRRVIDVASLSPTDGFVIDGTAINHFLGRSVASGDVNGDGIDDLVVGTSNGGLGGTNAGEAYVIFGRTDGFGAMVGGRRVVDLALLSGTQGFIIQGDSAGDAAGWSASAVDINGDGFDDVIIGAPTGDDGGTDAGEAYVIFGKAGGFGSDVLANGSTRRVIDLESFSGNEGLIIQGDQAGTGNSPIAGDRAGFSVSSAGDINGDGYDDLIVGALGGDDGGFNAGEAYVVFGTAGGFGTTVGTRKVIDLTSLSGAEGFIIQGDEARTGTNDDGGSVGCSVSSAGDINGDGFADLIVGARGGTTNDAGEAFVIFGKASGFGIDVTTGTDTRKVVNLANLSPDDGFLIRGKNPGDKAGWSVSSAGDINGDGFDDMLVGALDADAGGISSGEVYVVFGKADVTGFGSVDGTNRRVLDLGTLTATQGFVIQGDNAGDQLGRSVSSAGDLNGDGFDDLVIGAIYGRNGTKAAGTATVIFGSAFGPLPNDVLVGGAGNDTLTGGFGVSVLRGGAGDDQLSMTGTVFRVIDGGNGFDTLRINGALGGLTFDVDAAMSARVRSIEAIDLVAGSGGQLLSLNRLDVLAMSDERAATFTTLVVKGGTDNSVELSEPLQWVKQAGTRMIDGESYDVWRNGQAELALDSDIAVKRRIDLTNLSPDSGFVIQGDAAGDNAGGSVSFAGDINGDGFADIIIGAARGDTPTYNAGKAYVIFGKASGFGTMTIANGAARMMMDLTNLAAADGFVIQGIASADYAGFSVSNAGDVNGDGLDDLLVGAPLADGIGKQDAGETYVIYGKAGGFGTVVNLAVLSKDDGFILKGANALDGAGGAVSSVGDLNGDGFDDLVIGAAGADHGGDALGEATVFFGRSGSFGTIDGANRRVFDLGTMTANDGFVVQGDADLDQAGNAVASAGDINGDGYADLVLGVNSGDDGGAEAGEAYVIFGKASGFGALIDLTNLSPLAGFIIQGDADSDGAGVSVDSAGDINGDGLDDLIVGALNGSDGGTDAGEAYVIFGKTGGFGTMDGTNRNAIELKSLSVNDGFIIQGKDDNDHFGMKVSSAGDVNGDGFADLIVGSLSDDGGIDAGGAVVLFGKAGMTFGTTVTTAGFDRQVVDLADLASGAGFVIQGDLAGDNARSVSSAGDINRDGFDDLIVGAFGSDDGGMDAGGAYVIFGGPYGTANASVTTNGTAAAEMLIGGLGNDTLIGSGGADALAGGAGDDLLAVTGTDFTDIDGGHGFDTLRIDGGTDVFDFTAAPVNGQILGNRISGIEVIDLSATGAQTLTLDRLDVLHLSDNTANGFTTLIVLGGGNGDAVRLAHFDADTTNDASDTWITAAVGVTVSQFQGMTFTEYHNGLVHVLVETNDVGVTLNV